MFVAPQSPLVIPNSGGVTLSRATILSRLRRFLSGAAFFMWP